MRSRPGPLQVAALRQNTSTSLNTDVHRCRIHTFCLRKGIIKSTLLFFFPKVPLGPRTQDLCSRVGTSWQHLPARPGVTGRESFLALQFYVANGIKMLLLGRSWRVFELENCICRTSAAAESTAAKNEAGRAPCCSEAPACHRVCWPGLPHPHSARVGVHGNNNYLTFSYLTFLKVSRCHLTKSCKS